MPIQTNEGLIEVRTLYDTLGLQISGYYPWLQKNIIPLDCCTTYLETTTHETILGTITCTETCYRIPLDTAINLAKEYRNREVLSTLLKLKAAEQGFCIDEAQLSLRFL